MHRCAKYPHPSKIYPVPVCTLKNQCKRLLNLKGGGVLNISRRATDQYLELTLFRDPGWDLGVIISNRMFIQCQGGIPRFSGHEEHLIECHELFLGPSNARLNIVDIYLHHLRAADRARVRNWNCDRDLIIRAERGGGEGNISVCESRITQSVAE